MLEQQAKWLFDEGGLAKAQIVPAPMGAGWHLQLVRFSKAADVEVLERQRGGWRVFKSIDAAVNAAQAIGFRRVEVELAR
jgi:hypothetical protein